MIGLPLKRGPSFRHGVWPEIRSFGRKRNLYKALVKSNRVQTQPGSSQRIFLCLIEMVTLAISQSGHQTGPSGPEEPWAAGPPRDPVASKACANPLARALGTEPAASTPVSVACTEKVCSRVRAPKGGAAGFRTKPRGPGPVSSACALAPELLWLPA